MFKRFQNNSCGETQIAPPAPPQDAMRIMLPTEVVEASSRRRGSLFLNCNTHTQNAIVELRSALESLNANASKDLVEFHIHQALEVLLAQGDEPREANKLNAFHSTFHKGLEEVSQELSVEVSGWLSVTYSPRQVPGSLRFNHPGGILRQMSDLRAPLDGFENSPQTQAELDRVMDWDNFDIFALHKHTGGHPLSTIGPYLFRHFNLHKELNLDTAKVQSYWSEVEMGYQNLSYHNCTHAADVMQVVAWFLNLPHLRNNLEPLEICAALVAAGIHDHDHPGVNNDFLIRSKHKLAMRYNDKSVLEQHHVSTGLRLLQTVDHNNFLSHLDEKNMKNFRRLVVSMVLATDMSNHFQLQADWSTCFATKEADNSTFDDTVRRSLLLEQVIHCADLANCGKPFHFAEQWGERVVAEFLSQGDKEQELGLSVSPMTTRSPNAVEKSQMAFIQHVVKPMLEVMVPVLPPTEIALNHAHNNIQHWGDRLKRSCEHEHEEANNPV